MIDLHTWPTPNGWKVAIMLEECELPYRVVPVDIGRGEQHADGFRRISPNGRIPAIVDDDPEFGGEPVSVFETGAILRYLAEKAGRFAPADRRGRVELDEWLFWQVGGLGPMAGQLSHYRNYAEGEHPYSLRRYAREYRRCLEVLDRRLDGRPYVLGTEYSIADMACWPWVLIAKAMGEEMAGLDRLRDWRARIKARPAVRRGVDLLKERRRSAPPNEEERRVLFNQRD